MSMFSRLHSRDREIITVTAADEWLGYCIADMLLCCSNRRFKVRALCRDKDKCERLRRKGAEVCEIDYDDRGTLDVGVRYSKWIVFVVEKEHDRVDKAEALCDVSRLEFSPGSKWCKDKLINRIYVFMSIRPSSMQKLTMSP